MHYPKPTQTTDHTRYDTLDGLRGIAAIGVMLFHFVGRPSNRFLCNAPVAVDLFYILSGFVIAHSYGGRLKSGAMGTFEYVGKRLIRLYPMYLAGLVIGLPTLYLLQKNGLIDCPSGFILKSFSLNAFCLPAFSDYEMRTFDPDAGAIGVLFPANNPAWSLFFEIVISGAFPLLVHFNRTALVAFMIVSSLAYMAVGFVHAHSEHRLALDLELGWSTETFYGGFPRVMFGFSCGILIYRLLLEERFRLVRAFVMRFVGSPHLLYLLLAIILLFPLRVSGLYAALVITIAAPLLVYVGSGIPVVGSARSTARFLGWISYPIYCLHHPIGTATFLLMGQAHYSWILALLVSTILTVLAAALVTWFYEEPVRFYLNRKLFRQKAN